MTRQFEINDRYRPIVTIKKIKKDIPTVIEVSGRRYVHDNADTYKGGSGMAKKKMNHAQKVILQYHLKNLKQAKLFHEKNIHISTSLDYAIFAIERKLEVTE